MRISTWKATVLVLAGLLGVSAAQADGVTTNPYWKNNTAADIASSCKDVSIGSSTGVVAATCNYLRTWSDDVEQNDTTLDVEAQIYCSTGRDLWVVATCTNVDEARQEKDGKALDDGLDNSEGSLARTVE